MPRSPSPRREDGRRGDSHDRYHRSGRRDLWRDRDAGKGKESSRRHYDEKDGDRRRGRSRSRSPRPRHRSRSRSRDRKHHRSSRRSPSSSSSSDESADDRSRRHREKNSKHRNRNRSRSRSRSRERKETKEERRERKRLKREKKEKKKAKKAAKAGKTAIGEYGKYGIITEADYYSKDQEYRAWLVEEKMLNPETVPAPKMKELFRAYMEDYNTGTLPHEKYYALESYERRMNAIRSGETVAAEQGYDPRADELALSSASRGKARGPTADSYLVREQIEELRKLERERVEASRMKRMGMDVKESMGVRYE